MPVTLKSAHVKYKDSDGHYVGINSVSDNTTAEQVAQIQSAGTTQVNAVAAKGAQTLASIPQDYTTLSNDVGDLKSAIDAISSKNYLFKKVNATNDYDINVTGANPTIDYISRYDGGISLKAGKYLFCAKIHANSNNTETVGTFSILLRTYGTTTNIGTVSPASVTWSDVASGTDKNVSFTITLSSDATVYVMLFGTSHTTGKVWGITLSNMALAPFTDNKDVPVLSDYFTTAFREEYNPVTDIGKLQNRVSENESDIEQINDTIDEYLDPTVIENLVYTKVNSSEEYNVSVTGVNPTLAYISRYDGGISLTAGKYIFGANVGTGENNTETSGSISVILRQYNTTTNVGTTSPSSTGWGNVVAGVTTHLLFEITLESDMTVYLMLFGTSHTTGKVWDAVLSNMFFCKVQDNSFIDLYSNYFLNNFSRYYGYSGTLETINGRISTIEDEINGSSKSVVCWGDSITHGAGGDGTTYPLELGSTLGNSWSVMDYGVGGENAQTIAGRSGAIPFILMPCTLTLNQQAVNVVIKANNGEAVQPVIQRSLEFRTFIIQGKQFYLAYDSGNSTYTMTSRFSESGSITISEPTVIIPTECELGITGDSVACICIGTNGWGSTNVLDLADIIQAMIKHTKSSRYIVIGMPTHYSASSVADQLESDRVLGNAFGDHFVNLYAYLCGEWALASAGITPTADDLADISEGKIPRDLRSDGTHLNADGYTLMAEQVYKCGKRLRYWE